MSIPSSKGPGAHIYAFSGSQASSTPRARAYLQLRGVWDLCNGLNHVPDDLRRLCFRDDAEERSKLCEQLSERLCVFLLSIHITEPLDGLHGIKHLSRLHSERKAIAVIESKAFRLQKFAVMVDSCKAFSKGRWLQWHGQVGLSRLYD